MFSQVSVCPQREGGVCPIACWDAPLRADTPPWQTPPVQCMLGYGQQTGGTHPTGMHSCLERIHVFTLQASKKRETGWRPISLPPYRIKRLPTILEQVKCKSSLFIAEVVLKLRLNNFSEMVIVDEMCRQRLF